MTGSEDSADGDGSDDPSAGTDTWPSGYDELAARADEIAAHASPWGDSPFQRHHAWPATRELLPSLDGSRVLVAGCGRGDHLGTFRHGGASVVGVDASGRALAAARERFDAGPDVGLARADLTDPLPFPDGTFDLVCSHMVFGHLPEWRPTLRECRRVLTASGTLVLTTAHPEYLRAAATGHRGEPVRADERVPVTREWGGVEVTLHYRPVSAALGAVLDAGFRLDRVTEPPPRPAYESVAPERYRAALARPEVLALRAVAAEQRG